MAISPMVTAAGQVTAYVLYFKILESAGTTKPLLATLLIPVSAVVLGSLFLNEWWSGRTQPTTLQALPEYPDKFLHSGTPKTLRTQKR